MPLSKEEVARLHETLEAEVAAEEERNPSLDCNLIRRWLYQQLDDLDIQGWPAVPPTPPLEPKAGADRQDEMDALDEVWRRAIARVNQEFTT